jgi:hypothetical protein
LLEIPGVKIPADIAHGFIASRKPGFSTKSE